MIDLFALALTHGLLALAAWRLLQRDDLDREPPRAPPPPTATPAAPPKAHQLKVRRDA